LKELKILQHYLRWGDPLRSPQHHDGVDPFKLAQANDEQYFSTLGELERPPRLGLAIFLALDHPAVAAREAAALEHAAQLGLEIRERLGNAVAHRASLAGQPAARYPADDIVLAVPIGHHKRLRDHHPQHRPSKKHLDLAVVDRDLAGAAL